MPHELRLTKAGVSDANYLYQLVERTMRSYVEATWGAWRERETRDMLDKAVAESLKLPVRLRVLAVNPAHQLYARLGFVVTNRTPERLFMEHRGEGT